jgi:CRP-like cAMP-binding protein
MLFFDLFRHSPEFVELHSGEVLFQKGDHGDEMYVVIEGEAEISIDGVLFEQCVPGSFIGEMAVIDGSPRYATVTARTDCKLVKVDKKRFHFLVDETPGFAIEIMRVMSSRLKKADQRVIDSLLKNPSNANSS